MKIFFRTELSAPYTTPSPNPMRALVRDEVVEYFSHPIVFHSAAHHYSVSRLTVILPPLLQHTYQQQHHCAGANHFIQFGYAFRALFHVWDGNLTKMSFPGTERQLSQSLYRGWSHRCEGEGHKMPVFSLVKPAHRGKWRQKSMRAQRWRILRATILTAQQCLLHVRPRLHCGGFAVGYVRDREHLLLCVLWAPASQETLRQIIGEMFHTQSPSSVVWVPLTIQKIRTIPASSKFL